MKDSTSQNFDKNIKIRELNELSTIKYDQINNEWLEEQFLKKPMNTLYVLKEEKLYGIITEGDYRRYLEGKQKDLIKVNFTYFYENEEKNALNIFRDCTNKINCIPIINSRNHLLYELYVDDLSNHQWIASTESGINYDNAKQLIEIFNLFNIKTLILARSEKNEIPSEQYNKLFCNSTQVIVEMNWDEIYQELESRNWSNTVIVDLDYEKKLANSRGYFLQKYKVQSVHLRKILTEGFYGNLKSNYAYTMNMFGKLYKDIMVIGDQTIEKSICNLVSNGAKVITYISNLDKLEWDYEDRCFSYKGEGICPEVVVSLSFFLTQPYIKINGKKVVLFSLFSMYSPAFGLGISWNYDVAWNIIPHLIQHNITPILIADPDHEQPIMKMSELGMRLKSHETPSGDMENIDEEVRKNIEEFLQYPDIDLFKEHKDMPISMRKGYPLIENYSGKYYNIFDGTRYTEDSSGTVLDNKIYLFGPCTIFGYFTKDEDTIASVLQKKVNNQYNVINMGIPTDWTNNFRIRSNQYNANDVIIIMVDSIYLYEQAGFKVHSILDVYDKIPELWNHIWDSRLHCNKVVNKYIAERFCELLPDKMELETNTLKQSPCMFGEAENQHIVSSIEQPELKSWRNSLDKFDTEKEAIIGSIVMNCNPFTFGHRYLIEYASQSVDYLYIFLVEENRSFFDFNDRMEIVKKSVEDLRNVKVLPSGSYIISAMTLPDYFRKEELQDIKLDATIDLELFSTKIAPYLNITVRFAGEEPLDKFTRQYNKAMNSILPKYGIKFVEIKRKQMDDEPISASKVRRKLKEGDYESIKRLVPEVTYNYLVKRFGS